MFNIRTIASTGALFAAFGLGAIAATPAMAETVTAKLAAANEVPANPSTGMGALEGSFDKQTKMLNWTVTYSGLTGPVKAGHFHGPAMAGQNSGVALGFTGSVDSPIKGTATLTDAQAADLLAGKWYVNLHTAAHASGEVRGQVVVAP